MGDDRMNQLRSKQWWNAAGTRAIKTAAQSALAVGITASTPVLEVDWFGFLSVVAMSTIFSLLTSLAGLPEVD